MPMLDVLRMIWTLRGAPPTLCWRLLLGERARRLALLVCGLAVASAGCVPSLRYDEAVAAREAQVEAHRRATLKLEELQSRLASLQADLAARDQRLADGQEQLSAARFETDLVKKQRDEANQLVDQLRGELGRVGGDLRVFAVQKEELQHALDAAAARSKELAQNEASTGGLVSIARDLSAGLSEQVRTGKASLEARGRTVVLGVSADDVFDADAEIVPEAERTLDALARAVALHSETRIEISQPGSSANPALAHQRFQVLLDALTRRGIEARRVREAEAGPPATPTSDDAARQPQRVEFTYLT